MYAVYFAFMKYSYHFYIIQFKIVQWRETQDDISVVLKALYYIFLLPHLAYVLFYSIMSKQADLHCSRTL